MNEVSEINWPPVLVCSLQMSISFHKSVKIIRRYLVCWLLPATTRLLATPGSASDRSLPHTTNPRRQALWSRLLAWRKAFKQFRTRPAGEKLQNSDINLFYRTEKQSKHKTLVHVNNQPACCHITCTTYSNGIQLAYPDKTVCLTATHI